MLALFARICICVFLYVCCLYARRDFDRHALLTLMMVGAFLVCVCVYVCMCVCVDDMILC